MFSPSRIRVFDFLQNLTSDLIYHFSSDPIWEKKKLWIEFYYLVSNLVLNPSVWYPLLVLIQSKHLIQSSSNSVRSNLISNYQKSLNYGKNVHLYTLFVSSTKEVLTWMKDCFSTQNTIQVLQFTMQLQILRNPLIQIRPRYQQMAILSS